MAINISTASCANFFHVSWTPSHLCRLIYLVFLFESFGTSAIMKIVPYKGKPRACLLFILISLPFLPFCTTKSPGNGFFLKAVLSLKERRGRENNRPKKKSIFLGERKEGKISSVFYQKAKPWAVFVVIKHFFPEAPSCGPPWNSMYSSIIFPPSSSPLHLLPCLPPTNS